MKKFLAIFLIALFVFQVSICQEVEEDVEADVIDDNGAVPSEEEELEVEEMVAVDEFGEEDEEWTAFTVAEIVPGSIADKSTLFGSKFIVAEKIGNHQIVNSSSWGINTVDSLARRETDEGYTDYRYSGTWKNSQTNETFNGTVTVRAGDSEDLDIMFRVIDYTSYTLLQTYEGVETNVVYRIVKDVWEYDEDGVTRQFLTPGTLEPQSDEALVNDWVDVSEEEWTNDQTLQEWTKAAGEAAIQKALRDEVIENNNWYVYYIYPSKLEYMGVTYYRCEFILLDMSQSITARGNAYITKDQEGNFMQLTSGVSSYEWASDDA